MNKQNCCYRSSNNINELHQHPPHTAKVSMWCALSSHGITGPYCFAKTEGPTVSVNTEWYKVMLGNISAQRVTSCVSKICCGSNKMEQLLTQHRFPRRPSGQCFQADSFLILGTSPCPPARLTLQYQITSNGAMLNVRYMKHFLPILLT